MNKAELVAEIANDTNLSKDASERALNSLMSNVTKALKKGQKVTLVGFGTWSVTKRKARKGRNPQTGATLKIPAKNVPKFTAGKELKTSV
ncbi:MAG: HU family DNA-binding protein [bacterium]